jgi:hypothetical protein
MIGIRFDLKRIPRRARATPRGRRPGPALSVGPPTAIIDAALLLDPTDISEAQAVIFHGVFTCGLKAMLRDGCTHLFALTSVWPTMRVTLCRQQRDHGYD